MQMWYGQPSSTKTMVLNLVSIESKGCGEIVSGVRRQEILSNKNKIQDTHFIFPTTKGSMNACMKLVGFHTRIRTTVSKR